MCGGAGGCHPPGLWSAAVRDPIRLLRPPAASDHLFFPIQDVFGWRDRINTPATVGEHNWTWRLPWLVDTWLERQDTRERAAFLGEIGRNKP